MTDSDRVILIDDDDEVRRAATWLLEAAGYTVDAYASAESFLAAPRVPGPSCLVLDIQMPGVSGIALQDILNRQGDDTPVVFISGHADVPTAVRALKNGAVDLLQKPFENQALLARVRAGLDRHRRLQGESRWRDAWEKRYETLSIREREVLDEMVLGHPNKVIADHMNISVKTVEIHRQRVMRKMNVESLAALVGEYVRARGLPTPAPGT